jgi:DnaK suppressor protein
MSERSINDMPEGYVSKVDLEEGYVPNKKEEYMCDKHVEYFRRKLVQWQDELERESQETIHNLKGEVRDIGDDAERASRETENTLELRTRDRYRKLLSKIHKALVRIQDGDYGYCEDTDEEIGLKRLMARPIATMTIDAQERWELRQKLIKEGR